MALTVPTDLLTTYDQKTTRAIFARSFFMEFLNYEYQSRFMTNPIPNEVKIQNPTYNSTQATLARTQLDTLPAGVESDTAQLTLSVPATAYHSEKIFDYDVAENVLGNEFWTRAVRAGSIKFTLAIDEFFGNLIKGKENVSTTGNVSFTPARTYPNSNTISVGTAGTKYISLTPPYAPTGTDAGRLLLDLLADASLEYFDAEILTGETIGGGVSPVFALVPSRLWKVTMDYIEQNDVAEFIQRGGIETRLQSTMAWQGRYRDIDIFAASATHLPTPTGTGTDNDWLTYIGTREAFTGVVLPGRSTIVDDFTASATGGLNMSYKATRRIGGLAIQPDDFMLLGKVPAK